MARRGVTVRLAARLPNPKTTVRWRLTLLYGGLFLVCGAALLAVTYALVAHAATTGPGLVAFSPAGGAGLSFKQAPATRPTKLVRAPAEVPQELRQVLGSPDGQAAVRFVGRQQQIADLHQLEIESAIALAIMALISGGLGWLVAGGVLRPLRTITAETQQISEANLHRRLSLPGPRDELRTLADTIDGLLERLEDAFDAQRRFVANASHELRTPLTAVRALLEMVISDPHATPATFRATCREALVESEQQEQLIDALLALAQGHGGLAARQPIDLGLLTAGVVRAQRADADAAQLKLDVTLEAAVLEGDRHLIGRLVLNLVQNAIRHNLPGGDVRVAVRCEDGQAVISVVNTGPVVPAGEIERLLQPFQRLGPERSGRREGFGLGLSIVAAIATAHGAALDIYPGEDGGLFVEVRFPRARQFGDETPPLRVKSREALPSG
ncbi:MAG: HAMP domain-containing histidine kinase [Solirubrobacterales bacterium]|nr:HAMP domain-containing histidine kinase [Solirubrobacterales bacterium]